MYTIEFSKTADKKLSKLELRVQERILSALERIRIRPYAFVLRLVGSPYYRLRVGDYRLIIEIIDDRLIVYVIEIGHRKNIYFK